MPAKIMDGKTMASEIISILSRRVSALKERGVTPCLAVVMVGKHAASEIYVRSKEGAAKEAGLRFQKHFLEHASTGQLLELIGKLNEDPGVHGMIVQLPLPEGLDQERILSAVSPEKDADGFHVLNMGGLFTGREGMVPCTPLGIVELLERSGVPIEGRHAVIVNRSNIVGKPLAMLLLKRNATVTICHSRTRGLGEHTRTADILVAATGTPGTITGEMVKEGAAVIDVGISRVDGRVVGDVDFHGVKEKAAFITPVPGGVGPMTAAMLLRNTVLAAERQTGGKE